MEAEKRIVLNTSSGLFFTKIGLLPHILKYFTVITTEEIFEEVKEGTEIGFKDAKLLLHYFEEKKIEVMAAVKTLQIVKGFGIKKEDASVIALAEEQACFLATEDRQIEKICLLNQIKIVNAGLLLYYLWQKNEFRTEQALLLLELLMRNGYNKEICVKIKEKIMQG